MPSALKYASIFSRRNGPMSLSFTLPEASRASASACEQILPGAFRDRDDGVRFCEHPLLQRGEERVELETALRE